MTRFYYSSLLLCVVLSPGPSVQWSVCEGRGGQRVHIWIPMDKGLTAQGWLGSVHHHKDDVLQLKQLLDILLLETCWPTDDNYQKIAIHIRFKLPSRKMYFIVHFSFDTETFGFQYSSNMENNKNKLKSLKVAKWRKDNWRMMIDEWRMMKD